MNFEQRASYRDRADCSHTTPSSYRIRKEMAAAMTSHSIKMERQCNVYVAVRAGLLWSKFSVEIDWQRRTYCLAISFPWSYNTRFFLLGYTEDPVYVPPLQRNTHAATWCQDELQRLVAPAICTGTTGAGLRTMTPLHIRTCAGQQNCTT